MGTRKLAAPALLIVEQSRDTRNRPSDARFPTHNAQPSSTPHHFDALALPAVSRKIFHQRNLGVSLLRQRLLYCASSAVL
jgi:hypothetical protein